MSTIKFNYPEQINLQKGIIKITAMMPIVLIPLIITNNEFSSIMETALVFILPLLITVSCLLYLGSWVDLEVDEEKGIYLLFLWKRFFIPWESVLDVINFDLSMTKIKIVVVEKKSLMWFYRIYSFFTIGSIYPSFHIHPYINDYKEILNILSRRTNKSNSKKGKPQRKS